MSPSSHDSSVSIEDTKMRENIDEVLRDQQRNETIISESGSNKSNDSPIKTSKVDDGYT